VYRLAERRIGRRSDAGLQPFSRQHETARPPRASPCPRDARRVSTRRGSSVACWTNGALPTNGFRAPDRVSKNAG
jgi:hypothetical protein